MFGDFVTSLPDNEMQAEIKSFVKSVTDAGAYTFEAIGKNFGDPTELYGAADENGVSKNQVPTYKLQYKRDGTKLINPTEYSIDTSDPSLLTSLIYDNEVTGTKAKMNYESFLYYFVTVMALGLVDSPCKNMNLKKFVYQIVAAFYDMDTAFGKDNAGRLGVSTYAFTDYWLPNNDGSELKNATIYRDYKPLTGFSGYDIPSSYLFAIVKYASTVLASKPNLDP
jgi:hypothetical protein